MMRFYVVTSGFVKHDLRDSYLCGGYVTGWITLLDSDYIIGLRAEYAIHAVPGVIIYSPALDHLATECLFSHHSVQWH